MNPNTQRAYQMSLRSVRNLVGATPLSDASRVIKMIEESKYSINTKKLYYNAIRKLETLTPEADALYREQMGKHAEKLEAAAQEQTLNEKEKEIFVEWNTILQAREKAREDAMDVRTWLNYVILSLYTYQPPVRLDYGRMKVVNKHPTDTTYNYLVWDISRPYFLFQEYKTQDKYKSVQVPIHKELIPILQVWLDCNLTDWFLTQENGEPYSENNMSNKIRNLMKQYTGKAAGVSQIRHSYISYMRQGEAPLKQQNEIAKQMLHSVNMSVLYRRIV